MRSRHLPRAISLCLGALPLAATAQTTAPAAQVEVRGDSGAQRRADVAGRQVVGRDELLRHGDARLADALQRVPGLTVEGRGGNTEVRLGGLGEGYTQLLLNGVALPRGTSLDSIALDSLERVEIVRGASVQSGQAIAGSINLVTRRPGARPTRELKLQAGSQWGRPQASATLNLGGGQEALTWGLGTVLSHEHQRWPASWRQERYDGASPTPTQVTLTDKHERDRTDSLSVNPRLAWKREEADGGLWQWSTDHSLRVARSRGGVVDVREPVVGPPPAQLATDLALNYERLFWRGRVQALRRLADGAQFEARLNLTHVRRDQHSRLLGDDFNGQRIQDATVVGLAIDQSAVLNLNHQRPLGEAHRLDIGTEFEQARRREDRVQTEVALPGGLPPQNLDERYNAQARRWALYAQDDWAWSAATAIQLGVRLERLDTTSEGNVFDAVRQRHRLVGPVLRLSTQPAADSGTFKLGLSRGFKLPVPRDVMPRRYVPAEVSATAPAMVGNPDLRPERAWSLDGSWHRPGAAERIEWVVSAALRRIDDVILDQLIHQPQVLEAPWLLQRFNGGRAWSAGLEVEARGQTALPLWPTAPLRWQASLALHRSKLLDVAGEHAALAGQAPWQAKLDLTQRLAPAWTAQLGLTARGRSVTDQPSGRQLESLARQTLSASLAWQRQPGQTWRLSAQPLGGGSDVEIKTVRVDETGTPVVYRSREAWHRQTLWRLGVDVVL